MKLPEKLVEKLTHRKESNSLRALGERHQYVDFSSNDYLGLAASENIYYKANEKLKSIELKNGATGSRLLSGNHELYGEAEAVIAGYHEEETALLFNSGYTANLGFFSAVPQRGDVILYDELIHASIRDGIGMSHARGYKYKHNNLSDLDELLKRHAHQKGSSVYVVTESVFSMDGDQPDLNTMIALIARYNAYLIVDEAHSLGVTPKISFNEGDVFARIITFGKGLGCHGAAILGSETLKSYLVNFSRSFIYTTGLPPHAVATIIAAYEDLKTTNETAKLQQNIAIFKTQLEILGLKELFIQSTTAIQCCVIKGNDRVKEVARQMQEQGFDVKPILSPTVAQGEERLRFCLHSTNSEKEIIEVLTVLATFVNQLFNTNS